MNAFTPEGVVLAGVKSKAAYKNTEDLLRAQRDLGIALNATHGLPETLQCCLDWALAISGLDCGGIYLRDDNTGAIDMVYHVGLSPDFAAHCSHYEADSQNVRIISAGNPIYIQYDQLELPAEDFRKRENLHASALIPVPYEGQVIACLNLADHTLLEVPDSIRTTLETIASQIGNAIARAKTSAALHQSQENFQTLFDSLPDMVFVIDLEGIILQVNPIVIQRLGYTEAELYRKSVLLVHPADLQLEVTKALSDIVAGNKSRHLIPIQTKDGLLIPAETCVTRGHWNNQEVLFGVSRDITERVVAEQELQRHMTRLEGLRQIGMELTAQLDLEVLLESIMAHAVSLLGADRGSLSLYRPESEMLECVVATGFERPLLGMCLRRGEGVAGKILETGTALIVDDYRQWEARVKAYDDLIIGATVGAPICWGKEFLGALTISADLPRTFSAADATLLEMFATRIAIAIRNASLLKDERDQRAFAEALVEATAAVNRTLDLDQVLDRILEQVARVVPGDACNVMLVGPDDVAHIVRWREYRQYYDGTINAAFPVHNFATLSQMVRTREPLVIADVTASPDWIAEVGASWERAYVGAPIYIGDTIAGFLNVDSAQSGRFTVADAQRLKAFAGYAAVGIEHARLYQELRDYATALEQRVHTRTAELEAQYARLDAILDSTVDGIVVVNREGQFLQINSVARQWLEGALSPEDAAALHQAICSLAQPAQHGEQPITQLLELKGLDLELRSAPVLEVGAVVVVIHDVSHLKALERMKTRFITDISHELRTPVTAIQLYSHLIQQRPEKAQEYLPKLAQQADWQAYLVEEIQEVAHLDAGRVEIHPQLADINSFVETIHEKYADMAAQHNLELVHQLLPVPVFAEVDQVRLERALDNLIINAIHYTPARGRITLIVEVVADQERAWATIVVSDTGVGIPADELPSIFERFFRGARAQLMHPGSGLGLAIADKIVALHGGHLTVKSPVVPATDEYPAGGTAFTIWLPSAKENGV
ncbi:MAG: GAF domain-containing protein [Anaerolineae bacterium]|nr:GAF domain-containing protein [Anaerolineae bacterium]